MLDAFLASVITVPACLQNIIESNQVRLDICVRVGDRVSHSGLSRQVDDDVELVLGEQLVDERFVRDVAFDKGPFATQLLYLRKTKVFQRRVIIIIQVINAYNMSLRVVFHQPHSQVCAYKTGCSGEQNRFVLYVNVMLQHII